jgi:hypothetical protein
LDELSGHVACLALLLFPLQLVHKIDGVVEAAAFSLVDCSNALCRGDVGFAGSGSADQDQVLGRFHEGRVASVSMSAFGSGVPPNR